MFLTQESFIGRNMTVEELQGRQCNTFHGKRCDGEWLSASILVERSLQDFLYTHPGSRDLTKVKLKLVLAENLYISDIEESSFVDRKLCETKSHSQIEGQLKNQQMR